jgi:hypothetical protein
MIFFFFETSGPTITVPPKVSNVCMHFQAMIYIYIKEIIDDFFFFFFFKQVAPSYTHKHKE